MKINCVIISKISDWRPFLYFWKKMEEYKETIYKHYSVIGNILWQRLKEPISMQLSTRDTI